MEGLKTILGCLGVFLFLACWLGGLVVLGYQGIAYQWGEDWAKICVVLLFVGGLGMLPLYVGAWIAAISIHDSPLLVVGWTFGPPLVGFVIAVIIQGWKLLADKIRKKSDCKSENSPSSDSDG